MSVSGIAAGGAHTCAVTTAPGELTGVKCWGRNGHGQLGDNTNTDRLTPTSVIGLPSIGVGNVRPGGYHTCALTGAPGFPIRLMCWGRNAEG